LSTSSFKLTGQAKKRPTGTKGDGIEVYPKDVLSTGLFYWEYSDSIREGDGDRLLRCWRYMLPIFMNTGRKNYSIEAFHLLYQHDYLLPPRQAAQLLYTRFVNVHGLPGRNIAADLHMQHLNYIGKGCIKSLGANKTEAAIQRSAKALGTIVPVLENFDEQNNMPDISGAQKRASTEKDQMIITQELLKTEVYKTIPGRKHASFPHPKNILRGKKLEELKTWILNWNKKVNCMIIQ
jgi:L1 cell adhesion molecule like protein